MKPHGNSYENTEEHHLYEIRDKTTRTAYKFGICGEPLLPDGSSERAERQAVIFNRVAGWPRFFVLILAANIPGRAAARRLEDARIEDFLSQHGYLPPENRDHKKFKG